MNLADPPKNSSSLNDTPWLASLPANSKIETIAYVSTNKTSSPAEVRFPAPIFRSAIALGANESPQPGDLSIQLLTIPNSSETASHGIEPGLLTNIQEWIHKSDSRASSDAYVDESNPIWMQFQGTQIVWSPNRIAIVGSPEQIPSIRKVILHFAFYDLFLRDLEKEVAEAWPQLDEDMPTAFESDHRTLAQTKELKRRFVRVLQFRSKLAQISPQVYAPHTYPPTLASQIGERIRERTRMEYRHEYLDEQIEVFEGVYEMSGQKSNDIQIANFGYMLEWIIIVLLITQLLLSGFEMLTTVSA